MKKIVTLLVCVIMLFSIVGCNITDKNEEDNIEFMTIELTKDNYTDYIEFITTDALIDENGKIIVKPYVSVKSKLYDEGWVLFGTEDVNSQIRWNKDNYYYSVGDGFNIFGNEYVIDLEGLTTAKDMEIILLEGKYTFVKKDYVVQYECEPGNRIVVLVDNTYVDFPPINEYIGEFYPY